VKSDISQLVALIDQALEKNDLSYDEVEAARWSASGELEKYAYETWTDLKHWADDQDIFARDPQYAADKRERLIWLRHELLSRA
jgi:hypothetical protein